MSKKSGQSPTRENIVLAAQRLFHACGFSKVGINAVCAEAGVVKGSFYHFFPSKQELLKAVIERNQEELAEALERLQAETHDGRGQLVAQFSLILESAGVQKQAGGCILGCSIGTLASELSARNETARVSSASAFGHWQALLERAVKRGIEDGSIARTVDPPVTATTLLAVIQGMSVLGRSFNDPEMLSEIARTAVKRFLPMRLN